ncbi:hypothetical protein Tco_0881440 [Tanacetum coccineum]
MFANEIQHFEQPKSICNTCVVETGDSNVIPDSPDMCNNDIQNDQNAVESDAERIALANLITNLKLDCKSILAETSRTLGESNSIRDSFLVALQNKQIEFERYKTLNDRIVDYEKLEHKLNESLGLLAQKDIDIKECLKLKAYEILVVKEKHDELVKHSLLTKPQYEGLVKEKNKELVDQSWVKHSKDHSRAPTAHDIEILILTCLMPLALMTQNDSFAFVHELKQEMHADLNFAKLEKHSISLELALQQCHEQMKNDTVCKEKASNVFQKEREQYFEIQDLKAQLQDKNIAICELKKLIENCKGKSVETKFDKPFVVRQANAQRIIKPSVLGKPAPFSDSLERKLFSKTKSVPKTNVSEGLSKPVTTPNLPQTARPAVSNTNVIKPGMYRINTRTVQTRVPQLP